jgi:putative phage-type endonuclease
MLTPEQLKLRRSGIGSSEIAAVVGKSPFSDPVSLFMLKTNLVEPEENDAMIAGSWIEHAVADRAAHERQWVLQRCNRTLRHPDHEWMLATPDRFKLVTRKRDALVEIKTSMSIDQFPGWGEEGSHEVPPHIHCQVQQQMSVTKMPVAHVVLFTFLDRRQRYYEVPHSPALEAALVDAGSHFWHEHVLKNDVPELDPSSEIARRYLAAVLRQVHDEVIPAPLTADAWAEKLFVAKRDVDEAETREREAENYLKAIVGEHRGMAAVWGKFLWSKCKGKVSDAKLIDYLMDKLALPEAERNELRERFRGAEYRKVSFHYNDPNATEEN